LDQSGYQSSESNAFVQLVRGQAQQVSQGALGEHLEPLFQRDHPEKENGNSGGNGLEIGIEGQNNTEDDQYNQKDPPFDHLKGR